MQPKPPGLRSPLALAFAAAMLAVVISGAVEFWGMERLDRVVNSVHRGDTALANAAEDMREDVLELRRYEKDVFMNIGTPELDHQYRDKWDRAFVGFRYDLERARRTDPTQQDPQLQQVTDLIAAYRVAFTRIYDGMLNGTIQTTQQANEQMSPFKVSVRDAEQLLADISDQARGRQTLLAPALVAHKFGLAASVLACLAIAALFVACLRRLPSAGFA
ncbi:MAG: hypothetical protein JSR15_12290 [Proteobacteria bacterium]|nr:hypothetical protein [Pseudomonadota bacterium]